MAAFFLFLFTLAFQTSNEPRPRSAAEKSGAAPFTIAVLRRDGIVSPFAAFDGKQWTAPWPGELRSLDVPIDMPSIPAKWWGKAGPISEMTAWVDGANRGPIHLQRSTVLPLMCESRLALVSDYRSTQPQSASLEPPFPKDGLAVSGTQRVERIEIMTPDSREWAATASFLAADFDSAEDSAIEGFTEWKHPVPRAARRKMSVELEALYRAPMD